jgi:hypothetical protein
MHQHIGAKPKSGIHFSGPGKAHLVLAVNPYQLACGCPIP